MLTNLEMFDLIVMQELKALLVEELKCALEDPNLSELQESHSTVQKILEDALSILRREYTLEQLELLDGIQLRALSFYGLSLKQVESSKYFGLLKKIDQENKGNALYDFSQILKKIDQGYRGDAVYDLNQVLKRYTLAQLAPLKSIQLQALCFCWLLLEQVESPVFFALLEKIYQWNAGNVLYDLSQLLEECTLTELAPLEDTQLKALIAYPPSRKALSFEEVCIPKIRRFLKKLGMRNIYILQECLGRGLSIHQIMDEQLNAMQMHCFISYNLRLKQVSGSKITKVFLEALSAGYDFEEIKNLKPWQIKILLTRNSVDVIQENIQLAPTHAMLSDLCASQYSVIKDLSATQALEFLTSSRTSKRLTSERLLQLNSAPLVTAMLSVDVDLAQSVESRVELQTNPLEQVASPNFSHQHAEALFQGHPLDGIKDLLSWEVEFSLTVEGVELKHVRTNPILTPMHLLVSQACDLSYAQIKDCSGQELLTCFLELNPLKKSETSTAVASLSQASPQAPVLFSSAEWIECLSKTGVSPEQIALLTPRQIKCLGSGFSYTPEQIVAHPNFSEEHVIAQTELGYPFEALQNLLPWEVMLLLEKVSLKEIQTNPLLTPLHAIAVRYGFTYEKVRVLEGEAVLDLLCSPRSPARMAQLQVADVPVLRFFISAQPSRAAAGNATISDIPIALGPPVRGKSPPR